MKPAVNVVIIGASGYTGADAIRLLAEHPFANIMALTAHQHAEKNIKGKKKTRPITRPS